MNVGLLTAASMLHAVTLLVATTAPATVDLREMGFPAPVRLVARQIVYTDPTLSQGKGSGDYWLCLVSSFDF